MGPKSSELLWPVADQDSELQFHDRKYVCPCDLPVRSRSHRGVVSQEEPELWLVRGLEHDLSAEARTIGETIRAAMLVMRETGFQLSQSESTP
jgi:hypothetical protein